MSTDKTGPHEGGSAPGPDMGQAGDSSLLRREFLGRSLAGAGALALGGGLAGSVSTASAKNLARAASAVHPGKSVKLVTFGAENDAILMDPAQCYDFSGLLVVPSITEQLFRMNNAGQLTPNLAASYDLSNPRKLVLKIRKGVRFHDGTRMTVEDVLFSMKRNLNPATSLFNYYYANVERIAITGADEITAFMKQPDIQFLNALSTNAGAVVSKAFVEKHGKAFGSPEVGSLGTGPYRFVSWKKGLSYTVARNPDYWNAAVVPRKVETFTVRVITDEATLIDALRAGELEGQMNQLSGRGVHALSAAANIKQYRTPSGGGSLLDFNVTRPPWNDPRVRQALSLIIPRQGLIDSVWGHQATLVKSPVTPSDWSYGRRIFQRSYNALPDYANTAPTGSNLTQAKKLIAEANAQGGKGTIWVAFQSDSQQAQAIQAVGSQIGLDLSVNLTTQANLSAAYESAPTKRPYDMMIGFTVPDLPDPANMMWLLWLSTSVNNYMGLDNATVNAAIKKQFTITNNQNERARLLTSAQAIVVAGQSQTPLVCPDVVLSLRSGLGGYHVTSPQFQWDCQWIGSLSGS